PCTTAGRGFRRLIRLFLPRSRGRMGFESPALAQKKPPIGEDLAVRHVVLAIGVITAGAVLALAADTQSAANTRNKKLKTKISVEFNDVRLEEALETLKQKLEDADAGPLSFQLAPGVS